MFDNIVNYAIAAAVAGGMHFVYEVPIEMALLVGFVALVACTLADISRHLRRS